MAYVTQSFFTRGNQPKVVSHPTDKGSVIKGSDLQIAFCPLPLFSLLPLKKTSDHLILILHN